MKKVRDIKIADYTYELPEEKIAFHALGKRDDAKLLLFDKGMISEDRFYNIKNQLSADSLLVYNDSKVINARLQFYKDTGGKVEIFCLEPAGGNNKYDSLFETTGNASWHCLVGGAAKWKDTPLQMEVNIEGETIQLFASKVEQKADTFLIAFSWNAVDIPFIKILEAAGAIPLPPYIHRAATADDEKRYQTIFANLPGSVAAPTAGLHFTEEVLESLREKKIKECGITLHVGAGTFKPVKAETLGAHEMHGEFLEADLEMIQSIASNAQIVAVGTTSVRTLESLYWLGCKLLQEPNLKNLSISQWEVYEEPLVNSDYSKQEAFIKLCQWMEDKKMQSLFAQTEIIIVPGYRFRVVDRMFTNFHQPQSTLLLLIAAAIGEDWRRLYDYALGNDFRFLSYGDSSLLTVKSRRGL